MKQEGSLSPKTELALELIKTLIYFRARKLPVPLPRLIRFSSITLGADREVGQVLLVLEKLKEKGLISCVNGFYGWGDFGKKKVDGKNEFLTAKMKITLRATRVWRHLPFLRLIAVSGTVAAGNPREESDIDLFLVTKKGRIWTTRFFCFLILELMGQRKKGDQKKDRFCLNCFLAEDGLEMKFTDLYSAQELLFLKSFLAKPGISWRIRKENAWAKKYLSGLHSNKKPPDGWWQRRVGGFSDISEVLENLLSGSIFDWLEKWLGEKQSRRIERKRRLEKGGQVYWGNDALIFHPEPKSVALKKVYEQILTKDKDKIKNFALSFNG